MTHDITINGKLLSEWGATMLSGSMAELLKPAPVKDKIINDNPLRQGVEVVPIHPRVDQRDVTLEFIIEGEDRIDFFRKYNSFLNELRSGEVTLCIPTLNNWHRLWYLSATSFDHFRFTACRVAIKFKEPDPNFLQEPEDQPE